MEEIRNDIAADDEGGERCRFYSLPTINIHLSSLRSTA